MAILDKLAISTDPLESGIEILGITSSIADDSTTIPTNKAIYDYVVIPTSQQVTLLSAGWTASGLYFEQELEVIGVTTTNIVLVTYTNSRDDYNNYNDANIIVTSQTTDSLVFQGDSEPIDDININIIIF